MSEQGASETGAITTILHYTYGFDSLGCCILSQPFCYCPGKFHVRSQQPSDRFIGDVRHHWDHVLMPKADRLINQSYYDDTCLGPHNHTGNSEALQHEWIHTAISFLHEHDIEAYGGYSVLRSNNGRTVTVEIRVLQREVRAIPKKSLKELVIGDGTNLPPEARDDPEDDTTSPLAPGSYAMERTVPRTRSPAEEKERMGEA